MIMKQYNINELLPADYNPRKELTPDDREYQKIKTSIETFGYVDPIIINKDKTIIGGHQRLNVLRDLGYTDIDVIEIDIDKTKEKALNVALNKISGEWDIDKLGSLLNELKTDNFDLDITGFDADELDGILFNPLDKEVEEVVEDDYDCTPPEEPKSKLGDIYQLGNHRLMCGDSTSIDDVEKLMNGNKADMVFTDPPYGMKKENDGVANDNLNYDDLLEFNKKWIPLTFQFTKDNGSWYCWGIDEPLMDIYSNILKPMQKENKITFRNLITWNKFFEQKPTAIEMMRSYCIYDEKCLFVMCGVQGFNNNSDNYFEGYEPIRKYLEDEAKKINLDSKKLKEICGVGMFSHWFTKSQWDLMKEEYYKQIQEYCIKNNFNAFGVEFGEIKKQYNEIKKQYNEIKKQWYETRAYFDNTHETYMTEVWNFKPANDEERESAGGHATPKPIALCSRAIKSSSREEEIVLDVFGGSGSTLIACEQLKRNAYLMELEPKWIDVIIDRWETFTGKKAIKI